MRVHPQGWAIIIEVLSFEDGGRPACLKVLTEKAPNNVKPNANFLKMFVSIR